MEIKTNTLGAFLEGRIHSFRQSYTLGPRIDSSRSAAKTMKKLSMEDFPENPITIDDHGNIFYVAD